MVWSDVRGKCDGQFLLFFYIVGKRIRFIEQNMKVLEKLNYRKILAYLL